MRRILRICPTRRSPVGVVASPSQLRRFRWNVAGIETSCDDTAVGVVVSDAPPGITRVAADVMASQFHLHGPYAGIVPHFAARAHSAILPRVWQRAMETFKPEGAVEGMDALAVTVGPGLSACLSAGLQFAKSIASSAPGLKYFIPVNHLEAHLLVARLMYGAEALPFPFLVLLVSGGHTQIILAHTDADGIPVYDRLGGTIDDSLGECFDKVARLINIERWTDTTTCSNSGSTTSNATATAGLSVDTPPDPVSADLPLSVDLHASTLPSLQELDGKAPVGRIQHGIQFRKYEAGAIVPPGDHTAVDGSTATTCTASSVVSPPPPLVNGHMGAALECLASSGIWGAVRLPVPMRGVLVGGANTCTFSFSGLKSAVNRLVQQRFGGSVPDRATACNIAAGFHMAAITHVCEQVTRSLSYCKVAELATPQPPVTHLVVCGGVAANSYLREALREVARSFNVTALFPPPRLCTDNGVMVAWAGAEKLTAAQAHATATGQLLDVVAPKFGIHVLPTHASSDVRAAALSTVDFNPRLKLQ